MVIAGKCPRCKEDCRDIAMHMVLMHNYPDKKAQAVAAKAKKKNDRS